MGQWLQFFSSSSKHPFLVFYPLISLPLAKQKLEDRLAAAAREKLAQASKESKEKQLQAERKRKAALFLQTLRSPYAGEPEAKRAELDSSVQLEVCERLMQVGQYLSCVYVSVVTKSQVVVLNNKFVPSSTKVSFEVTWKRHRVSYCIIPRAITV